MTMTMPPTHDTRDAHEARSSFSSQSSNPDTSAMSFESSFRLESGYPTHDSNSEKHPKGKRKRTTTQDKAILEAAYNSNPKPDKAARLDIVGRVSLNEKEVQIWFQNRRQNDRRKSRPLSPQEIAALRYGGGVQILSSDPVPTPIGASASVEPPEDASAESEAAPEVEQLSPSPQDATPQHSSPSSPKLVAIDTEVEKTASVEPESSRKDTTPSSQKFEPEGLSFSLTSSTPAAYISNRRSFGSSFSTPSTLGRAGDDSFRIESFSSFNSNASSPPASILPPPSSSSSSQVRLSLSLDGKAELVSAQPSPPRPAQLPLSGDVDTLPPVRANRTLHRSRSALPGITLPPISTLTAHLPPQLTRGRSRDVHAWESCCEADTRDELTKQAENESSGSAVAAISLLRSSSSSASLSNLVHGHSASVLQPNPGKRNAPTHRSTHREGGAKKAKLSRATSSVARMQSLPPAPLDKDKAAASADPEKKPGKGSLSVILSPSGDSDKENWSPDEEGNPHHRRRPLPSPKAPASTLPSKNARRVGRVLGEQDSTAKRSLLFGSRANTAPSSRPRDATLSIFEDKENSGAQEGAKRDDREVEGFMRGSVSPSKRGDMDCVAGLLSLSQGNWR
ncbi:NAD(+) kinase [Hypoxylon texense]